MLELNVDNAIAYLAERGWVTGGFCQVEVLSGGVSNIVFRVRTFKGHFVLKQSRSQLRTTDPWFSDLSRIFREIDAMKMLAPRLPNGVVPEVLFRDNENYAFLMSHAPRDARDWRTILLEGKIDPSLGEVAGRILGKIHESTSRGDAALAVFRDKTVFDQLRVDPFYRRVAQRCPDLASAMAPIIDNAMKSEICLCHGDYSPKNLLLHADGFTLVDYETAHLGDPAFDIGFFLSHLYLKALVHPGKWDFFNQMFAGFWRGYQDEFAFRPFLSLIGNGIAHLGACLMARADGTSPAPYLDEQTKNAARRLGRRILLEHLFDWTEVVGCLHEECERLAVRE